MTTLSDLEHQLKQAYEEIEDIEWLLAQIRDTASNDKNENHIHVRHGYIQFVDSYGEGKVRAIQISPREVPYLKGFLHMKYEQLNEFVSIVEPALDKAMSQIQSALKDD